MTFEQIKKQLEQYRSEGKKYFTSSSFQSHSIVLLHLLSRIDRSVPVYFLNTGFHFPETLSFRDKVTELLHLNLKIVESPTPKIHQRDWGGKFLFASDPDYCCYLNKTLPMEPVLAEFDVWINGVRADQSNTRKNFRVEEPAPFGAIRFHPMLNWNSKMIWEYQKKYSLPFHPMESKGYLSIGCEPCTQKISLEENNRSGRWAGMKKTECGLNTDLVLKS